MGFDVISICVAWFSALFLRFDMHWSHIPALYLDLYRVSILPYAALCVLVFWKLKLYNSIWRFVSFTELLYMLLATGITFVIQLAETALILRVIMPLSYYVWGIFFQFALTFGIRFSYRFLQMERSRLQKNKAAPRHRIMLVGAGSAGQMILREINHWPETMKKDAENEGKTNNQEEPDAFPGYVACIIDDDSNKWGRFVDGVPVVGGREAIAEAVEKYRITKIYVAIPSASMTNRKEVINLCMETGCEVKQLPGMSQLIAGSVTVSALRDISMEDLLGREPIHVDLEEVFRYLQGKTILVTGGGGSIGSELCRQIAGHKPKRLIIFDVYENNAYSVQMELRDKYPNLDLVVLIGSVRDSQKLFQLFEQYRPEVVYHAAAHKHVPLMEDSPCEAIKNNTIGTYKTAYAAMAYGCQRFVLISTDKAVNPTNVMGASKRLCEMIIQCFDAKVKNGTAHELPELSHPKEAGDQDPDWAKNAEKRKRAIRQSKTEFVAVRFGNVLGSNGSVIPLFQKQIQNGGPVTVTHPDIIRYFMTIPEAVSLVLLAGVYAEGGEIFVLDLGSPVKIDTLARNLIRLSGYQPDVDIKIEYTGLRAGEKLYEEMLIKEEGLRKTRNDLIFIGEPIAFDEAGLLEQLRTLMDEAYRNADGETIRALLKKAVPTYHPKGADSAPLSGENAEKP